MDVIRRGKVLEMAHISVGIFRWATPAETVCLFQLHQALLHLPLHQELVGFTWVWIGCCLLHKCTSVAR